MALGILPSFIDLAGGDDFALLNSEFLNFEQAAPELGEQSFEFLFFCE